MRTTVTLVLLWCMLLIARCADYGISDQLTCPGCTGKSSAPIAQMQPCTNCRIFVSGTTRGDMSGIGGCGGVGGGSAVCGQGANGILKADYICQNDPAKPDSSRTWKALVVDGTNRVACANTNCGSGTSGRVDWVLKPSTMYWRPDLVTIILQTDANAVFAFGLLTNGINTTIAYNAWTGLSNTWMLGPSHCAGWANATAGSQGTFGTSSLNDGQSIQAGPQNCDTLSNLYCVEQ